MTKCVNRNAMLGGHSITSVDIMRRKTVGNLMKTIIVVPNVQQSLFSLLSLKICDLNLTDNLKVRKQKVRLNLENFVDCANKRTLFILTPVLSDENC